MAAVTQLLPLIYKTKHMAPLRPLSLMRQILQGQGWRTAQVPRIEIAEPTVLQQPNTSK